MKNWTYFLRGGLRAAATLGLVGALGACDTFLEVENPAAIEEGSLDDPTVTAQLVNTVVSDFQRMYTSNARWGSILTDEAVTGHNFFQIQEFDLRIMDQDNSLLDDVYVPVQKARHSGEDLTRRMKASLGDAAATDLDLAKALAYGGYASLVLGETFCEAPVRPDEAALPSDKIIERALPFFDEAIQIATAAKAAGAKAAAADPILNLARVGAARAYLQLGNKAKAIEHAKAVPASFVAWVNHSDNKDYMQNPFYGATTGSNHNLGVDAAFRGLNDPRVRHFAKSRKGHNQLTDLWTPYQSAVFSGWTATTNAGFAKDTKLRFASGLEARYIVAEAEGLNVANLAFMNERRAVGGQVALAAITTDAEYAAALRDQRRRDFFLDGHRLGDLRRYKAQYNVDQFPSGAHPNDSWGNYDVATCYIPDRSERIGNPAY